MDAKVDLDLNDVALLVRVVQTRSFSAAARERGVPVSSVSRRIARLEAAIGTRLLERTTRKLQLTDAGREYFSHAERAVDDLAEGSARVRERQTEARGRVRVVSPIVFGTAVANAIHGYLAQHPQVSLELRLDDRGADLFADGYDIAVIGGRPETETGDFIARELWRSTRKLLYASPRYVRTHGAPKRIEDLAHHACIATHASEGFATWVLHGARKKRRVTIEPRFHVNESSAAHRAAIAGVGIAMLPEVICAPDVSAKRLVRVLDGCEGEAGGVYLLYRAHRALTVAVRTCVDHLLGSLPVTDPSRR